MIFSGLLREAGGCLSEVVSDSVDKHRFLASVLLCWASSWVGLPITTSLYNNLQDVSIVFSCVGFE